MSSKSERRKRRRRDVGVVVEESDKVVIPNVDDKTFVSPHADDKTFVIPDVDERMKESLTIVSKSTLTPECLESLVAMSEENKDFLNAIEKLGPDAIHILCQLSKDDNYVLTTKLTFIKLLNILSKKEFIHRILHKLGAVIQAIVNLKELITY
ncbi:MAG: hypothetical protein SFH39_11015 [Candidatus Magnetobacterium sp. LHC-1]|uniref:Uncharacterized protein n=1 Tax=Candidatus Magnetobacterium casense TaxID=1455061 RepID=A0ABS6S0M0_9BACT|nr:hypothetical protein [Candidatus Magnetobacterium casensis]MBF0609343.1 hypothetical protein [Nitrospirota bacterium]MBV6342356.1 hypothetical protein [Candidatus Magnetobacterium casensis]